MGMVLPVVGVETGPNYATEINNALQNNLDSHTHVLGQGQQITPAGININSNLPCNGFSIVSLLTTTYNSQVAALSTAFKGCVSNIAGNLYWNNGSGVAIQITAGSGINIASVGTIGGDYGGVGVTASVVYTNSIKTFSFTQASGVSAKMAMGDIALTFPSAGTQAVTLKADAATAAYSFTFPTALPVSTLPLSVSSTGAAVLAKITSAQIAAATITNTEIAAQTIIQSSLALRPAGTTATAGQIGLSTSSGVVVIPATGVNQTIVSVSLTTTGRPVYVGLVPDGSGTTSSLNTGNAASLNHQIYRDTTQISTTAQSTSGAVSIIPVSSIWAMDTGLAAGTYVYSYQVSAATFNGQIQFLKLIAYEI